MILFALDGLNRENVFGVSLVSLSYSRSNIAETLQSKTTASDAAVLSILNRGAVAEVVVGLVLFDNLGVFALFYECIGLRAASEGHVPEFVADLE